MESDNIQAMLQQFQQQFEQKKTISSRYATIRLLLLIFGVVCVYYGYNKTSYFYYLLLVDVILFLWFAFLHRSIKADMEMLQETMSCYQDILKRKSEEWKHFDDEGSEYLNERATQAYDLDIFGHASLFQYLSCAKTILGRDKLASMLTCQIQDKETIMERQQAVQEMSDKQDFNIQLTALLKQFQKHARKKKKQTMEDFFNYMEEDAHAYPIILRLFVMLLSLCTIASMVYVMVFQGSIVLLSLFGVASVSIAMLSVMKHAHSFREVNIMENTLRDYQAMFETISNESFQSTILKQHCVQLHDASLALKKLNFIVNLIRIRNDGITFLVFNFFFLIDFECVFALEIWKKRYGKQIRVWYESLATFEAILSLSQLRYAKQHICNPHVITDDVAHIVAKDVYHPLLCEDEAISNSIEIQNDTYIITGSNMSGKTTFLRTLGLNFVLFHAGAAVCGSQFSATSMNLFTSMRIKDNVSEGISTFYAEILRIKEMIEESSKHVPMIVLVDEIFKGTNSADRIVCAKEVLKQLHLPHVISMVSTHDFELCDLYFNQQDKVCNYHFSEYYEKDAIRFDYTLKNGKCKTTNARELLKLAGITIDTTI